MNFPTQIDDLSSQWLSTALGANINDFRVETLAEGAGLIGQVVRLHLSGDGPATVMAKFAAPAAENVAVALTYNMYAREVHFFQHLADQVPVRKPQCFYAAINDTGDAFVLLLEDVGHYRLGDQVAGCSLAEAEQVVRAIARLQAACWQPSEPLGLISHNNPAQRDGMIGGFKMGWPVIESTMPELIPTAARDLGHLMPGAIAGLLEHMCQAPVCLSHADIRLDNVFFTDDDSICLIDWQSVCTSSPEHDLAYFVTQSVPTELQAGQHLCDLYLASLQELGIAYDRAQFQRRYALSALYLLNYAVVIAGTLDLGNERGRQLGRALISRSLTALDQLDAFALLPEFQ